jgi:putative ABC transport system ATP-binding protein
MALDRSHNGRVLAASNVIKNLGGNPVLNGLDLTLAAGESLAITGPSGSGKSTLLRIMSGLLKPDEGFVYLDNLRIDSLPDASRRRLRLENFGFVFQFGDLIPELRAIENVMLPGRLLGYGQAEMEQRALEIMCWLGVDHKSRARIGELSGGELQRVGVARAMVLRPAFVFADEPTGSLDDANTAAVIKLLIDAVSSANCGLVLVTHSHSVARFADRVGRMEHGVLSF